MSLGFTGVEGTSEGRSLGIRHPKIEGQRENNGKRSTVIHSLCERWREMGGRGRERERKSEQRPRGIQTPSPASHPY